MYHSLPWPGQRTASDEKLQKHWCPKCQPMRENFEGLPACVPKYLAPRTEFDKKLQYKWCPKCKHCGYNKV